MVPAVAISSTQVEIGAAANSPLVVDNRIVEAADLGQKAGAQVGWLGIGEWDRLELSRQRISLGKVSSQNYWQAIRLFKSACIRRMVWSHCENSRS